MAAVLVFGIYALVSSASPDLIASTLERFLTFSQRGFLYGDVYRGLQDTFYQHVKEYTRNRSGEKSVHNRLRIRDAILYTTHNAAFQVLSMLLITVCLPIILIWTCAPDTWAHYISLSVTLVWLWTILPLVVILFQKVWHDTWGWDFAQLIIYVYGVAVVGFTLAFPALLISIGNVPQISPWSRTLRISVSVAVPIGLFIFMCVVAEILSRRYPTSWLWSRIWRYLTKRVRVLTPPAPNTE